MVENGRDLDLLQSFQDLKPGSLAIEELKRMNVTLREVLHDSLKQIKYKCKYQLFASFTQTMDTQVERLQEWIEEEDLLTISLHCLVKQPT